jgi:hypothetical protein
MKTNLLLIMIIGSALLATPGCAKDPKDNILDYVERTDDQRDTVLELEEGTVVDVTGTFYFTLRAVIATALPLQFIATTTFTETETGGNLDIRLQALSLNIGETEEPREMVGDLIVLPTAEVDETGAFEVDLGEVSVIGSANAISGSDIVATLSLKGTIQSEDVFCGGVEGNITDPIKAPLSYGDSSFAAVRLEEGEDYPSFANMLLGCPEPGSDESDAGSTEDASSTEDAGEAVEDAGSTEDAGEAVEDAGSTEDAGEAAEDAGSTEDAGEAVEDAGSTEDAGEAAEDAGSTEDAGEAAEDAGSTEDAGEATEDADEATEDAG